LSIPSIIFVRWQQSQHVSRSWSCVPCVVLLGPYLEVRGGRRQSAILPFKRAMTVSYRLSIVSDRCTVANIRPQFAIECHRRSIIREWGHFRTKFEAKRLIDVSHIYWGCCMQKKSCHYFLRLSTVHERDSSPVIRRPKKSTKPPVHRRLSRVPWLDLVIKR